MDKNIVTFFCLDKNFAFDKLIFHIHHTTVSTPALGNRHLQCYNRRLYKRQTVTTPKSMICCVISVGGIIHTKNRERATDVVSVVKTTILKSYKLILVLYPSVVY